MLLVDDTKHMKSVLQKYQIWFLRLRVTWLNIIKSYAN